MKIPKKNNEKLNKLMAAFYDYIGEYHIDNICAEIDSLTDEIERTEVPRTLDEMIYKNIGRLGEGKNRKKPVQKAKKAYSRVAIAVLVLFISLITLSFSVDAFRYRIYSLFFKDYDEYSSVKIIEKEVEGEVKIEWENYYFPKYLPDGFYIEKIKEMFNMKEISFKNNNGDYIVFIQAPNGTNISIDTEGGEKKEVVIRSRKAILSEKDGKYDLFWNDEECSFLLTSNLEEKQMRFIAESIEKK